jgi:hypothetical protein
MLLSDVLTHFERSNTMSPIASRIVRAVLAALIAGSILLAGAAPYGQPGPHGKVASFESM